MKNIEVSFGKPIPIMVRLLWNKRSIFFDHPHWQHMFIKSKLNMMYVEKNIYNKLIKTLLNIQGKTKVRVKVRLVLVDMTKR